MAKFLINTLYKNDTNLAIKKTCRHHHGTILAVNLRLNLGYEQKQF